MRYRRMPVSALGLLLAPGLVHAQTAEVQQEVETRLWILRILAQIEAATGAPPFVSIFTLVGIVLAIIAAIWLYLRRNRGDRSTKDSSP